MRLIRYLFVSIMIGIAPLFAIESSMSDSAKATEDIAYLSQKIANDYLYLYNAPKQKEIYLKKLRVGIRKIQSDIRLIAVNTKNEDIKNILDFLSYDKDKIKRLSEDKITYENALSMLDESDALIEGLQSIISSMGEKPVKEMVHFHIMKLSKLYMAIHLKFDSRENTKLFSKELQDIDILMKNYNQDVRQLWKSYKEILDPSSIYFLPNIVSIIISDLERNIGHR